MAALGRVWTWLCIFGFVVGSLAACGGTPIAEPAPPNPTAPPRPTERVRPATVPSYADLPQGRTPEGYPYLGAADAPVTLVMFSDFL
jgi:hypothetical protein